MYFRNQKIPSYNEDIKKQYDDDNAKMQRLKYFTMLYLFELYFIACLHTFISGLLSTFQLFNKKLFYNDIIHLDDV